MKGIALYRQKDRVIKRSCQILPLAVAVAAKPDQLHPVKTDAGNHVTLNPATALPVLWQVKADIYLTMIWHDMIRWRGAERNNGA